MVREFRPMYRNRPHGPTAPWFRSAVCLAALGVLSCNVDDRKVSASGLTLFGPGDASADASGSAKEATLSAPKLELTPIAFDFGPIALGFPARGVVFVFNSGNAPMAVP